MTEDEAFNELEARLKRQALARETDNLSRASVAAAEFIASQTADLLAITTLRKAFEYGYRTGFRDASKEKK
jgi:flagellar biosynthesis/type III secretory pathway protein FliH